MVFNILITFKQHFKLCYITQKTVQNTDLSKNLQFCSLDIF